MHACLASVRQTGVRERARRRRRVQGGGRRRHVRQRCSAASHCRRAREQRRHPDITTVPRSCPRRTSTRSSPSTCCRGSFLCNRRRWRPSEGGRTTTTDAGIPASVVEHWLTMSPGGPMSAPRPLPDPEDGRNWTRERVPEGRVVPTQSSEASTAKEPIVSISPERQPLDHRAINHDLAVFTTRSARRLRVAAVAARRRCDPT